LIAPLLAALVVLISLALIFTDRLHHTVAAMAGAAMMMVVGKVFGFYGEAEALAAVEFDALALLLGMMMLVSILEPTGFFQYMAVVAGRLSRGDPWRLMLLLSVGTALISFILNNVTTIVLVGPITILITELLGISPVPILMAQALLSVTAGMGTSVGDPASVLVASASGYSFTDFLTHALPIVTVSAIVTLMMFRVLFSKELSQRPADPAIVNSLRAEEALHDRRTIWQVLFVLAGVVGLFLFQQPLDLSSGFIALLAASLCMVWVQPNVREVLQRVDWPVLIFFVGFFIMVGGLEAAGAFDYITQSLISFGQEDPVFLGIAIMWVVAALSALVDNVPVTIAMISLLRGLGTAGVDISPLWWAVVFGAGFGGNATSIGSTANIVVVSLSRRTRTPITPRLWSKRGLPVAFVTCIVGSIIYALAFPWLGR
jgi:Na+/H+ antiporter NhaD/arsenite permease-like protein